MKRRIMQVIVVAVMAVLIQSCTKDSEGVLRSRGTMDPDGKTMTGESNGPGGAGSAMDPNGGN